MSVGGITRSPSISGTDDDDLEEQELEQELYASAFQSSASIGSEDPNGIDDDPNDSSVISSGNQGSPAANQSSPAVAASLKSAELANDDRVSEPAPARSQTTQKVIGMRAGVDPMLAIYEMEAQHDSAPEPNVVKSKDNA